MVLGQILVRREINMNWNFDILLDANEVVVLALHELLLLRVWVRPNGLIVLHGYVFLLVRLLVHRALLIDLLLRVGTGLLILVHC